ncbi:hypothetical protein ES705_46649 [subsurface metagenome]
MIIFNKVTYLVRYLNIPYMNTVGVQSHPGKMVDVIVDGLLMFGPYIFNRTVPVCKRNRVVNTEQGNLLSAGAPPHNPIVIHIHRRVIYWNIILCIQIGIENHIDHYQCHDENRYLSHIPKFYIVLI